MLGWSTARSVDARMSGTSMPARRSAARSSGRESGLRPGASSSRRTSATRSSRSRGRAPRGGRGPSRSLSSRSWTSTRHGTPAYVISAATSAPADSAARSSPIRFASDDAATAASWRASSTSARRCSAASSALKRVGCVAGAGGPSRSQWAESSPSSSRPSTAGARRSSRWHSRRSWQRSTRTPAASSNGYQRAVSSHTHRGASPPRPASRSATRAGRSASATSCTAPSASTRTRSPGRRVRWTRAMGTLSPTAPTLRTARVRPPPPAAAVPRGRGSRRDGGSVSRRTRSCGEGPVKRQRGRGLGRHRQRLPPGVAPSLLAARLWEASEELTGVTYG